MFSPYRPLYCFVVCACLITFVLAAANFCSTHQIISVIFYLNPQQYMKGGTLSWTEFFLIHLNYFIIFIISFNISITKLVKSL